MSDESTPTTEAPKTPPNFGGGKLGEGSMAIPAAAETTAAEVAIPATEPPAAS